MKIEGQKYLNKNNYNQIVMDLLTDEYKVRVKCNKDYNSIKSDYPFMDEIMNLDDDGKTLEIIEYFLRNNKIVDLTEVGIGYQGSLINVYGSCNRLLALKLPNNTLGYIIIRKILNKFYSDRNEYCLNNDITTILTSSIIKGTYYKNNELCLFSKYNELLGGEMDFLKHLIISKLDYEHKARIEYLDSEELMNSCEVLYTSPYLICGDLKIQILDSSVLEIVSKIINQYNQELENDKKKQLVLKGWDD